MQQALQALMTSPHAIPRPLRGHIQPQHAIMHAVQRLMQNTHKQV